MPTLGRAPVMGAVCFAGTRSTGPYLRIHYIALGRAARAARVVILLLPSGMLGLGGVWLPLEAKRASNDGARWRIAGFTGSIGLGDRRFESADDPRRRLRVEYVRYWHASALNAAAQ